MTSLRETYATFVPLDVIWLFNFYTILFLCVAISSIGLRSWKARMKFVQLFGTKQNLINVLEIVSNVQKINHKISVRSNGFFLAGHIKEKNPGKIFFKEHSWKIHFLQNNPCHLTTVCGSTVLLLAFFLPLFKVYGWKNLNQSSKWCVGVFSEHISYWYRIGYVHIF